MSISTVTSGGLASYVRSTVDEYVESCLSTAETMVESYLTTNGGESIVVPIAVIDRAVLEVGAELYNRRNAPNGIVQFDSVDASPVRVARDPMVAARPILAQYMAGGFA